MKMKANSRIVFQKGLRRMPLPAAALCCFAVANHAALGQSVLVSAPQYSITPPALREAEATNEMEVFTPPEGTAASQDNPLVQLGPVAVRPHVLYRFMYGDGIPAGGASHVSTTIQDFSPGLLLGFFEHWSLDYTPTWRFYSSRAFNDTLDHNVRLTGGAAFENWTFGLFQGYSFSSAPLIETGTQTDLESFTTGLGASYHFNSKMWLDLGVNQNLVSAEGFNSYSEWSTSDWINYEFWPRLNAAAGLELGYANMDIGSDMLYERYLGRVQWRAADKVSFRLSGGVEDRQFLDSNQGDEISPIVGFSVQYEPLEVTRLSLNVDQTVTPSYVTSGSTKTTAIMADLNQRLLGFLYLDLGGGYHTVKYVGGTAPRTDDFYVFNARLSCSFLKRGRAAVFYQYSDNASSQADFSFNSNQVGFELGFYY
jgi:Putative beta-barrel porin 2